jgi:predicted rRNA methylase YqxC with S4 and FtsJ domains
LSAIGKVVNRCGSNAGVGGLADICNVAKKMATSRSQLDRVVDPENVSVQLDTLIKAARAVGKEVEIKIKRPHKRAA